MIVGAKIPEDIVGEIQKSFKIFGVKYVAARSSTTAEDSASASWAGQLESFFNITEGSLLEQIQN